MNELPELLRADCGHFIPADSQPVGQRHEVHIDKPISVYLCPRCTKLLHDTTQGETKVAVRK